MLVGNRCWPTIGGLALALLLPACGGAIGSGVALGKVGHGLSVHAQAVPAGAEVCSVQEAIAAQNGAPEKPMSEACLKAQKKDRLWQRSMIVLAAYGETLESIASGANADNAGRLEAAQTGVNGAEWIEVDGEPEKAARAAVAQLVDQLNANASKGDLARAVQDAGPRVKVVCDGLVPYLEAQTRGLSDAHKDAEKKRLSRSDRRCGTLDTRSVCVSESAADRVVYASAMSNLVALEGRHADARDAVAGFCAAHKKLEDAAAAGRLSKSETYVEIADAVKSARRAQESAAPAGKPAAPPKK